MMSVTNLNALQGLAPMTALGKTDAGKRPWRATSPSPATSRAAKQSLLLSIPDQQQQSPNFNQLVRVEATFS